MHKKQNAPRSIDGFTPRVSAQRSAGFSAARAKSPNFPGVGMTLSSYTNPTATPLGASGRSPGPNLAVTASKPRRFRRLWAFFTWKRALALVGIITLLIGGWLGFKFIYNAAKVFHGNVFSVLGTTKLKGEDQGRVNILLAGNSADDAGHQGGKLTDSIMVISIDTKHNTAFLLSVPRDLWVNIPGYGHAKINEAYVDGEDERFNEAGYFGGGMGLLQKVIQDNFNIQLNYYGLVDYNAFRDMVNAVGGINFNVQSSDPRGLYDPSVDYTTHGPLVKLTNGVHTLNGQQALDLARARGDAYGSYGFPQSDFDRTTHQRQMLLALRSKALSTGVLANPVKISSLLDAVGNNIKTNFSLSEVHRLYDIGKNINANNIQSIGLNNVNGKDLLASYASPSGQSALIPATGIDNFSAIQAYLQKLTSNDPVVKEGASVVVLNATDTYGLASKNAKALTAKGLNVVATGDAANQATTTIIDLSAGKDPATRKLLTSLYGTNISTTNPYGTAYQANFIVVLGADRAATSSSGSSSASTSTQ